MSQFKLALPAAIIMNINIMLGSGIFINTLPLAKMTGVFGAAIYALIGIAMLPLVFTIAQLSKIHPSGTFYIFGKKEINTAVGFLCSWSYFTAKLASSTLMIHFFSLIIQSLLPFLKTINIFALDFIIILFFTALNMLNLQSGIKIQSIFIILKAIPILFVILSGLFLFNTNYISSENIIWQGVPAAIPLVIFAFTGFEAASSISRHIKNPDKNAPKAIFISYAIVILILCSYQFSFYSILGPLLTKASNYFEAFPSLVKIMISATQSLKFKFEVLLQFAIAFSAVGGAYGILYSNNWNLYSLVENNHLFFSKYLKKLNRYNMPYLCIIIESFICLSYLAITKGNNIQLQQIGALGSIIAYTISAFALLFANLRKSKKQIWLPLLAVVNCLILSSFAIRGLLINGYYPLIIFLWVIFFGMLMYFLTKKRIHLTQ